MLDKSATLTSRITTKVLDFDLLNEQNRNVVGALSRL